MNLGHMLDRRPQRFAGVLSPRNNLKPNLDELSQLGMSATTHLGCLSLSFRFQPLPQLSLDLDELSH